MSNDFYVYVHRKSTTNEIFYVGKGKGDRAWDFTKTGNRSSHWRRTVEKHGASVELVGVGLQEWYAFELEIELIALYGRADLGLGKLTNKTDGGDGTAGAIISEEHKLKVSLANKGNTNMLGKKHSQATKDKIREKQFSPEAKERLKELHSNHKGWTASTETRLNMSKARKGVPLSEQGRINVKNGWLKRRSNDSIQGVNT